jgi:hypothetical protein
MGTHVAVQIPDGPAHPHKNRATGEARDQAAAVVGNEGCTVAGSDTDLKNYLRSLRYGAAQIDRIFSRLLTEADRIWGVVKALDIRI